MIFPAARHPPPSDYRLFSDLSWHKPFSPVALAGERDGQVAISDFRPLPRRLLADTRPHPGIVWRPMGFFSRTRRLYDRPVQFCDCDHTVCRPVLEQFHQIIHCFGFHRQTAMTNPAALQRIAQRWPDIRHGVYLARRAGSRSFSLSTQFSPDRHRAAHRPYATLEGPG